MLFKEWLFSEDAHASEFFYKLSLYPSDAFDGGDALVDPRDLFALQQRWKVETKQGRKFLNIDKDEYLRKGFVTVQSNTMPKPDGGFWRHTTKERPNIEPKNTEINYLGYGKNSRKPKVLTKHVGDLEVDLEGLFGDAGVDLKSLEGKKFDKPFRKVYEYVAPYIDVSDTPSSNTNMGVRSKYVGPDETGEKEAEAQPPVRVANFGFNRKHRKPAYIKNNLGRPYVEPQKSDYYLQGQSQS